jgi:hypothetical protein
MPDAPRFAHRVRAGLLELPVTTARFFDRNWPASGGGYFRLLPYALSRWLLQKVNQLDRSRRSSISIPGRSTPGSRALPGSVPRRAFVTTSTCSIPKVGCRRLLADFRGGGMDEVFLGSAGGAGGEAMKTGSEEVARLAATGSHSASAPDPDDHGRGTLGRVR